MKENLNSPLKKTDLPQVSKDAFSSDGSSDREKLENQIDRFLYSQEAGNIVAPAKNHAPPNDYLKSSEKLLLSLTDREKSKQANKTGFKIPLSPIRASSLLMVSVATILLGLELTHSKIAGTESFNSKNITIEKLQEIATNLPDSANARTFNSDLSAETRFDSSAVTSSALKSSIATGRFNTTVIIPGAYPDLASALLPPSFRLDVAPDRVESQLVPVPSTPIPSNH